MQHGTEATITDTASLLPENYRQDLAELANQRVQRDLHHEDAKARRDRGAPTHPFRMLPGRQVLIPGKRKARVHPWANRLLAARTGGVSVDETHPGAGVITLSCYGCGDRVEQKVGTGQSKAEQKAEDRFREIVRHHAARECVTEVTR